MKVNTKDLITIKNYAQSKNLSTTAIYRKVFEGKLNYVKIDGIKFIIKENTSPKAGDSYN